MGALDGRQHGVVSRAQLHELGFTKYAVRRRVQSKRLLRLYPGVYAVGHDALTLDARRLAAVLACGPGALLSHQAAGAAQHLLPSSPQFDVTARHARTKREGIVLHRSRLIHPDDRSNVRGIPVTNVARTLVDLADVLSEERLAGAVHEAEVRRAFDLGAVEAALARLPGRKGRHKLRRVLAARTTPFPGRSSTSTWPATSWTFTGRTSRSRWRSTAPRPTTLAGPSTRTAPAIAGWRHGRFAW